MLFTLGNLVLVLDCKLQTNSKGPFVMGHFENSATTFTETVSSRYTDRVEGLKVSFGAADDVLRTG